MKALKIITTIFLTLVFILSIALNILLFSSSYGSLMFKYNKTTFNTMNSMNDERLSFNYLTNKKNQGIQITITSNNEEFKGIYYVDENSELTFEHIYSTVNGKTRTITKRVYYKDNTLYTDDNGTMSISNTTIQEILLLSDIIFNQSSNVIPNADIVKSNDDKTQIGFSFSPLYFLGIKYAYTNEANQSYTYNYDLKGRIRKVEIKESETENKKYIINYKAKKVIIPDELKYAA